MRIFDSLDLLIFFVVYLKMFCVCVVLCADRVGQMTKTYSDIDAVTRLLEEVKSCVLVSVNVQY